MTLSSPVGVVLADYVEYVPLGKVQAGVLARDVAVVGGVVVEQGAQTDPSIKVLLGLAMAFDCV